MRPSIYFDNALHSQPVSLFASLPPTAGTERAECEIPGCPERAVFGMGLCYQHGWELTEAALYPDTDPVTGPVRAARSARRDGYKWAAIALLGAASLALGAAVRAAGVI